MSSESMTSSDAGPSGISVETQATSEAFSTTEAIHPPKTTAVTHMGTLSTAWEAHSSAPAVSETATGTSPIETSPTGGTTMAVTPTPGFAGTTEPQTQPKSSLAPQPQETITSQHTTSATEEITVPSEVSTGTRSGVSRTVFISRSGTSIPVPTRATVSPGIPMGINTRLSASPVMAESSPIAMATETIPPEAISQGMLAWGTLATALEPHTLSAVTQGSPPSDVTTSMDRRSEGVSLSSPSSEQDVGSPSSLVPLHAMTSSSAVSSTLPASSPFPSDSVTSPLTAGLPRTHITWGTSSEGVTSSPSGLSQTSVDVWTPSEVSTTTEAIHPSENTAVTHKGTLSSPWESRSSAPAGSEIATRMSPIKTSSLDGDATASTPTPGLSGTTEPETQPQSSMAPEPQETGTFPHTVSATEDMSISSKVSTESSAGASRTDVMFSSRTSTPGPVQLTVSPDILTEINTRLSTSPVKAESEPITMATETGPPGTTSQGTLAWDTSDTPSGAQTHSAVTQGSPHSEMTTSGDRVSEDESPASPSSEQDISSPSSLVPSSQVMSLTSSVSPTLPASSPFPSDSVTSPLTAGLPRTHITWGTSSEGVNSSPSGLSQTSVEIWATPEASTTTNTMPPSENTAVSQVGTLGTSRESHSSAPAGSESATGTSLVKTSSLDGDTMVSTPMPDLSATTEIKAQSMSSQAPEPRETGTSRHTSSAPEEITVLSELSTGNSAEASRTAVISPSRTSIPGPGRPTLSPDIPTGINNRLSISPVIAESSPISNTTKTVPRPTTSQGSIAWDSSATASWTEMHSVVTQSSPHSDGTTSVDRVSEAMSRRSPSTEQDIRSPSSLEPFHAMTSASAVSPTLPATSPSPPASVTSPLTLSLLRTWGMSSESMTSSDAGPSGISVETQATSEAFSTTEAIHPPKTTAVTHMGTLSTAWEAHSSAPAVSETATGTSPIETSPTGGTTMAVTPTPGFSGTTEPQTQPKSSLAPQPQETITSQHTTSATEEITVPFEVSTGTRSGVSRTVFISRSGTSIPVPTRATVSPGIPMGINTRLSASPVMAESSPIAMATETIPPEAISQGMLAWGTLATALEPHTLSAVTQGSPPSDVTTSMDRRSEGVSLSSPSSEQDVGSPSSLVPLHAMTSSSAVSSTLPASSPFPSDSVTSPLTAGLPRTHITWGTSSEGVTSSPSGLSQTSVDVWTPSEVSTTTEAIHPSENTAVTHKGTLSSPWESRSSAPAGSEIATRMSPIKTSSLDGDATASTPTPGLSGTTEPETQPQSSMAPEPQETGTFPHTVSATEDMSISSKVSTESSAGASRTDVMFSSRTSTPGPVQLTVSPDILTEINTRLSTSPVKAESEPITMATETGPPGTTSQGTLAWDTSDTPSGAQTHSAVTQGSPHSEMTTSGDRVSEDESPASPSSEQDISSPSSLVPSSQVMSLTSSVSPTLPASSPFPSDSVTSPLTAGLPRTHITWGTSSEGVNSSPSGLSQTSVEIWATPEASTTTNTMPPSENTAVSQVGTLGTSRESHSSAPAGSESATGTSLVKTSSLDGDTMVSTPMPDLSATTEIKAQSMSSQAPEPRETGTSRHTSSAPEEITVLSELSTGNSAEASRTAVISPSRTSIPGPGRPTLSPDIPTGINNRLSISPVIAESSPISNTTKTVPRPTTSQGSIAWDSSATASWTEMHSVVTQSSPHSDGTTSVDRVSEAMSRRSPSTEQDIRSPSSLEPFHAMTSASAVSPTLPATSPSPPASVTSPLTLSLLRTWGMSSESMTSSDAGPSGISVETQATSEAFSTTEAIHPPKTTAVTHMGTLSTAWEAHSSAPAVSETATGTSPIETSPTGGTTMAVTPTPGFSGTTEPQTQPKSSLAPQPQETITSQHTTSATEEITVPFEVSTGTRSGVSRTVFISRSGTSIPVPTRATVSPGIPMGINTRLSASPVMAESSPIAMATETIPPEAISQGMLAWGTLATALEPHTLSAVTQGSPPSDVTTSMDRRSEGVSLSSPSSEQDVGSPSSLVPLHAMTSSSAVSSTLPASSPFPSDSVTSPLTAGLPRTHITWGTSSEGVTSSPSGLSQTSVDVWTPSEVSTTTEAIHPSENTAVTHKGTLSSPWESRSSAPAGSEIATRMSPIKTSSLDGDATASTPTPGLSGTTEPETQPQSSMAPEPQETGTFPHTVSATEDMSISSKVSTESSAGASRTDVMFSSRTSTPGPVQLTVSPDILTEINTRLSTSPVKAESEPITMATETGPPGTTSQGTLAWDTSDTPSGAQTHSAVTQGSPHSEMTTSGDRVSEDESPASPSSEQDISSPSSLVPSSQVMSLTSSVSPTLPASSPFPSDSVTSPLTAGLPRTHITWGTSSEGVNSSPSGLSQTSVEIWATPEASTTTNTMPPSENTAVSQVGTLGTSRESHSSAPAGSESATGTSLVKTSSLDGDTMVSTPMPDLSATTEIKAQSMSSQAPEPRETGTSRHTSSAPEEITVLSELSTGNSAEASRTAVISPSRTSIPGPGRPTLSPDIPTGINNRLSISPVIAESSPISNTTKTVPRPTTSQGSIAWDSSATASWTEMHSVVTQSSPHSDGTTSVDRVSEAMSRRSPSTEQDIRSPSSLEPFHAMTSASAVSPTLPATSPSPPASVTSPLTLSLLRTWGMSSESMTSSDAGPSGISVETQATSEAFSTTEAIHPPKTTAVTHMGTLSTAWEAHSSAPAVSETATGTSPIETSPTGGTTMAVTPMPRSSGTRETETQSKSSKVPEPWETGTSPYTSSASGDISIASKFSTGTSAEASRTDIMFPSRASTPGLVQLTMSPDFPTEINTMLSTSPVMVESEPISMATETVPPGAISQDTVAWGTSATASAAQTHSAVTQDSPLSEMTTSVDRGSEDESPTSLSSEQDISSPSSLVPFPAMTWSSAVSSTLPTISPSPVPVTSPLAPGLLTHSMRDMSSKGVTSSSSVLTSTLVDIQTTSEASTTTEASHLPENTAVTHVGTLTSAWESYALASAVSETAIGTSPVETSSFDVDATASTTMPELLGTTETEIQSVSSLAPEPRATIMAQHTSSTPEEITVPSKVSTVPNADVPRIPIMSPSKTSIPGLVQPTMSPHFSTGITTRLSTSSIMAESAPINLATETVPLGATSQGTVAWDTSPTALGAQTHSAVTQGSPHSAVTSSVDRGSEGESRVSPSSERDISSPSSLVSLPAMTSSSGVSPMLPPRSFSPVPGTSPLTPGLLKILSTWSTSSEGVISSPSGLSQTSVEIWATPEASTTTRSIHLPENTAVTHVGTLSYALELHSSAPAGSEPGTGTSPIETSSLPGDATASTPMPGLSGTTETETQSMSPLAPETWETVMSWHTSSAPEAISILSEVSTGTTTEAFKTDVISSSRTSIPFPVQTTVSPDIPMEVNTRLSTSPVMAESEPITMATETVPPGATSQDTVAWDTTATTLGAPTHLAVTQGVPHSVVTSSVDRDYEGESPTSTSSEQDISSPSSLVPLHAMTSASAVSPTLPTSRPSPLASVTSPPLTTGLPTIHSTWGTNTEGVISSPSVLTSMLVDTWATSEASTPTEAIHLPEYTAVTHAATLRSAQESHSSSPASSEPATGTSPFETSSIGQDTTASTPMPGLLGTTEKETVSSSSLAPELWELDSFRHTSSATEEITVPPQVSTGSSAEASRTDVISHSRTSIPVPSQPTMSSDIPMGINTRLSTSLIEAESAHIIMATRTVPPGATSQGTLAWSTSASAGRSHIHSAITQGSPRSEVTTSMERVSENESHTSPSSEQDINSPSSLVPFHAMTSTSAVPPTLPATGPSLVPVTSPLTPGLMRTPSTWGMSSEGVTSSPSGLTSISVVETRATSEYSTATEAISHAENTAMTHTGSLSSTWESHSSGPNGSEPATGMSPVETSSLSGDTLASTQMPGLSGTTETEIQSVSSLALEPWETSISWHISSATEEITVPPEVSTGTSPEATRTAIMSPSRTSIPGPGQATVSPDIPTEIKTRLSTSPVKAESEPVTMTTETVPLDAIPQGTLAWDTSATASGAQTHLVVTQGSPRSEMTASVDTGSEDASPTSPSSEQDISSPSSLMPLPAMSSISSVSPTLPATSPSPPDHVTSSLTPDLLTIPGTWDMSLEGVTSSPSGLSTTLVDIRTSSEASSTIEAIYLPENTAVTHVGTLSSVGDSHSSAPAGSETATGTSPVETSSLRGDATASMLMPGFSGTTQTVTLSMSSLALEPWESGMYPHTSSAPEESTVPSKVPTGISPEASRTAVISPKGTSIPVPIWPTISKDFTSRINTKLSTSPIVAEAAPKTMVTETVPLEATSQGTFPWNTSATASGAHMHSGMTQDSTGAEMTTSADRGSEDESRTSPSSEQDISSPFPLVPSHAMTSASSVSNTLPASSLFPSDSVTLPVTTGLLRSHSTWGMSSESVTSSPSGLSQISVEIQDTSEASTTAKSIHPPENTGGPHVGTLSTAWEVHSSAPAGSTTAPRMSPIETFSVDGDTMAPTPMPGLSGTMETDTQSTSPLALEMRETIMSQPTSSAPEDISIPSEVFTGTNAEASRTDIMSPSRTSVPGPVLPTMSPDIPMEFNTGLSTSSPSVDIGKVTIITKKGPASVTSFPEPKLSVSVSERTHHLSTVMLSSAETLSADALAPSPSAATSGVPGASSAAFSASPLFWTQPGPRDALSTVADSLPSSVSTLFPSLASTTTDVSTSPVPQGSTSSMATPHTVATNTGTEGSTAEGPLVVASTLETWTKPVRTSLSSSVDTRMTEQIHLGTETRASQLPPHSTQLTRTDGVVERITKIPNEAAHGGVAGPVHVHVAPTSSASPTGLPTDWMERAETTSTATLTTTVSTPASGTWTLLRTSGKVTSTSTRGAIISTPDISSDVLQMTASLATIPGAETSTEVPRTTPSVFNRGSQTTHSLVPSSDAENGPASPTLAVSLGEPETTTSRAFHSAETSLTGSRATLSVSHSESDSTPPTATGSEEKVSLEVPTLTVFPGVPEMVTSLVTSPGAEMSTVISTLTDSQDEPETNTSWVTQPGALSGPSIPVPSVLPGEPGLVTSMDTSSGAETSPTDQTATTSPGEPNAAASLVTHPGAQTSSAIPTPAISPGVSGVGISPVTSYGTETNTTFTTLTDSPHEPETTASWVTPPGTEAISTVATSTVSPGEPDATALWVHSTENSTPVSRITPNFSQSELDTILSMATTPRVEASSAIPTVTVSSGVPATVTSQTTSSGTDTSTTSSTLTESLYGSDTTVSLVTHPAVSNPTVPRTTPSVSHSESYSKPSTATSLETEASSAVPTTPISPDVPDMVTSQATSSGTDASMVISTLTLSPGEPANTVSWVNHPGAQTSSSIPTLTVSPGVSGVGTSLVTNSEAETSTIFPTLTDYPHESETALRVTHSSETSTPVSRITPNFSHSESGTTLSTATTPGAEVSSFSATTISPGIPGLVTLVVTSSGVETSTTFSTLADSLHELEATASWVTFSEKEASSAIPTLPTSYPEEPDTAVSLVTHSAETSSTIPKATPNFSYSESDTVHSIATSSGAQTSSAIPTLTISPGVPEVEISLATSSGPETSTTFTTLTLSPGQMETIGSWVTHSETEFSSAVPTLPASPGEPGTVVSLVTHPAETSPTVSRTTPNVSHSELYTTYTMATSHGAEASSAVPTPTVPPGVPDMVTSQVTSSEKDASTVIPTLNLSPGEPGTTASTIIYSEIQTSSAIPAPPVSSTVPELVTSLVTSSGVEASTMFTTLTDSPQKAEMTASWVTHSGTETSSAVPTLTISPKETNTIVSSVTHSEETSPTVPKTTTVFSKGEPDTTQSIATSRGEETSSVVPTPTISLGAPDMVTSHVPISETDANMTIPSLTLSPGEPATTGLLVTHPSAKTSTHFPGSTAFPHLPETIASLSVQPELEMSTAPPVQTVSLGLPETTSFTTSMTETSRVDLGPTVSPGVPVETASLSTHLGTDITTISTSTLSPVLLKTTGLLATSPASEASTGGPTLTAGVLGPVSTPETTGESHTLTSWSTEPSPPVTSVELLELSKTVTGDTVTLIASETPTPPKTSHRDGSSPTAILKTTTPETTNLAATGSGPIMAETAVTFNTSVASPFVPETSPGMSTLTSLSVTSETTAAPFLMPFTVNFTITSLSYTEDMGNSGSEIFNATERHLQHLLRTLFENSSVGSLYDGCRLTLFRAEKDGTSTRIDAVCTYRPDPTGFRLDRERLYQELSQQTHGITQLGPYTLDRNSLCVNGYNHQYWTPTTSTLVTSTFSPGPSISLHPTPSSTAAVVGPALVPFTLNFTITNLLCTPDMRHPGSMKFNSTERALNRLLGPLFKNTSIGPRYSGCRLTLLRTEKGGTATGVDVICTYHPDPMGPGLNREELYQELSQLTRGVTWLGTYTLDRDSLYVNGYNHRYWNPTTSTPVTSTLSPESSTSQPPILSSTGVSLSLVPFTLNFTITNLRYTEGMGPPGSELFNSVERILNPQTLVPEQQHWAPLLWLQIDLAQKMQNPLGLPFPGDKVELFRKIFLLELIKKTTEPEKKGTATGVDAVCTHHPDPMGPKLDREKLYWELSHQTHGVTQLGSFTLDKNSLYVNGYTHWTSAPTPSGTSMVPAHFSSSTAAGPAPVPFTLNFTIINLHYTKDMRPSSAKFNSTESALQRLLKPLFANSSIGPLYIGCRVTTLRPERGGTATGVDAVCTYRPGPSGLQLDRERLYWELSRQTHGVTQLGSYILDRDRLYVNGYTRSPLTPIPSVPVISTPSGTSVAPISFSSSTVSGPDLVPFTLNFTITNLRYTESMQFMGSAKFNEIEKVLQSLLRPLLKNTSVGPLYSGCRLTSLRPEKAGAATRVNTICSYRPDPAGRGLDREKLYWELSRLTRGITWLGPYTLEQDSLCVSGYSHQTPVTAPSATGHPLVPFTLNFTITNLPYAEDMQPPGSLKFNTTERSLQRQLGPLFQNTSVGPLYSGCRLTLLRPEKDGAATGVDAVCTHRPDPTGPGLDRERLYQELSQLTRGVTRLGPYTLDPNSLYINGFTHQTRATTPSSHTQPASATTPNTTGSALVSFTLNFTITNLHYTEDMGHPSSLKFNSTKRILQHQLKLLLSKTSVGPLYAGCRLASLRLEKGGAATGVDIVCTIHSDPAGPRLDRERLYWELSRETHGITRLGPFTLDRDSLCVNGYTYGATAPTTTAGEAREELFTLNFTIDNLRYSADMGRPGSLKFNITDTLMQHLLGPLFQKSSLGTRYTGCKVTSLRPVKNGAKTRVNILCTYQQHPSSPGLLAKQVFHELSRQTRGITRLGPYSLDKDSLYLNGYNERGPDEPPTTPEAATTFLPSSSSPVQPEATTAMGHNLKTFTLNLTISNLQYSTDMSHSSATFNSTKRTLQHLLGSLFQKSSLGPFYSGCRLISFRPEKDGVATHVNAICTYHHDPMGYRLDREQLYWELSQLTHGVTQMGIYTLVRDSLFVNGYAPQNLSIQNEYQLNFRILNWNLSNSDPASLEYTTLLRDIQDKVTKLYRSSQLQDIFRSCLVTNLTMKVESTAHLPTDRPTSIPTSQHFQLNFTVTNLLYSQDLSQPNTTKHQRNKRSIKNALNQLFQNSSMKSYFSDCQVLAFRSVPDSNHTGVDSICNFSPLARRLDRIAIYEEFLRLTQNGTQLQNFTLDRNSVLVDGYSPNRNDVLTENSDLPFWAIILICLAGLLVLITCLICCFLVTIRLRKKEGDYEVQQHSLGYYLPHLDLKLQ
ncbi:mucin-16 isoform X1 [Prionailurus iriomotensis]